MRVSVIIGETESGKWIPVALPDKSIEDQKATMKTLIRTGGVLDAAGKAKEPLKLARALRFDQYAKRLHFRNSVEFKPRASIV